MSRALVIQLARFGDLLQTKRLISSLASCEVHICLDASLVPLAGLVYPDAVLHPVTAHATAGEQSMSQFLAANRPVLARMRNICFDEIYNLNFSGLNLAVSRLFDTSRVRGHASLDSQPVKDSWMQMGFRWSRNRGPWGINLMDFWGHLAPDPIPGEMVNPAAVPGGQGLGVVMAGRHARRSLPVQVLVRAAQAALGRCRGTDLVLLGSASEEPAAREFTAQLPASLQGRVQNLAGRTDWAGLVEAVSPLDAVLTPDTGTMHLAAHLGVPVLATFLSSAWCFETGPYGTGHQVFQALAHCAPCLESRPCDHDTLCLAPFEDRAFLRALAGRLDDFPARDGLVVLESGFDALGATCTPLAGHDPFQDERRRFRDFLARHLGLGHALPPQGQTASQLYLERDWMAPARPGGSPSPCQRCPERT
jgi:hypothetical protein